MTLSFSVDAALLRELGERLVGAQHIAVAELVKNAYDADATKVVIDIQSTKGKIIVADDGHGMTEDDVRHHFMRVGTTHKTQKKFSSKFRRALTGSKGVGRLSVQFLAKELDMATISAGSPGLRGLVDWETASTSGDLTQVTMAFDRVPQVAGLPNDSRHGTRLEMTGLKHDFDKAAIEKLASAIWWLRPPFDAFSPVNETEKDHGFTVEFLSDSDGLNEGFERHLNAIRDTWHARVSGKWERGKAEYVLQWPDSTQVRHTQQIVGNKFCHLQKAEFDIRIYHFQYRQPQGLKVGEARDYLKKWGGVQILDAGFRLPYYGDVRNDWLGIEQDHSHRLANSQLLPDELHVERGLNFLPTTSRMLGVVWVNTNEENRTRKKIRPPRFSPLTIQVTRDRLVQNQAQEELRKFVRFAIDWYAMTEAARQYAKQDEIRDIARPATSVQAIERVLTDNSKDIPAPTMRELRAALKGAQESVFRQEEEERAKIGLLASLATAGMAALAYRHEQSKVIAAVYEVSVALAQMSETSHSSSEGLISLSQSLASAASRAREIDRLFDFVASKESREDRARYRILPLMQNVMRHLEFLAPGAIKVDLSRVPGEARFPPGTLAEWHSIGRNLISNAYAAMLRVTTRNVKIEYHTNSKKRALWVSDTGVGIDLASSEELFKPFVRRTTLSSDQMHRGYGGSGLGLTIVRMIATSCGASVKFVKPEPGFSTRIELSWSEQ